MFNELPSTENVMREIGTRGVIVGSWPLRGDDAKDIDVVIKPRGIENRKNEVFERIIERWPDDIESEVVGHLVVNAFPMQVEIFEGNGWRVNDADKADQQLSYHQAVRRSEKIDCYGVEMRAVVHR